VIPALYLAAGAAIGLNVAATRASRRGSHVVSLAYGLAALGAAGVGLCILGIAWAKGWPT
jgi:hypothetical protein